MSGFPEPVTYMYDDGMNNYVQLDTHHSSKGE